MEDDLDPRRGRTHGVGIAQVRSHEPYPRCPVQVLRGAVGKVVESDDVVPFGHEPRGQVRTDEPCGTGNECAHLHLPRGRGAVREAYGGNATPPTRMRRLPTEGHPAAACAT